MWAHAFRFAFLTTLANQFEDTLSDGELGAKARPGAREERPGDALRREYTSAAKTMALAAIAEATFARVAAELPALPFVRPAPPPSPSPNARRSPAWL